MGRGRAKAKQTKVARDLKYRTHETDFGALARELHGDESDDADEESDQESDETDPDDAYADGYTDYEKWSDYRDPASD